MTADCGLFLDLGSLVFPPVHIDAQMTVDCGLLLGLGFSGVSSCPHTDAQMTVDCGLFWVWVSLVFPCVHTETLR